jgi:drug/metabolite transporter (DMT)-like permease
LVVVARAVVAFFFATIIARAGRVKLVWRGSAALWVRSLAGSTGMLCNFYALAHLPVSDTLTLMNTSPIWVTLLLWLMFGQRPTVGIICAVGASVAGIALIQQPHFQSGKFACLMALCGSFCTSIAMLGLNRLKHLDPRAIVTHFSGVAGVATVLFLLLTNRKDYSTQLGDKSVLPLLLLVGAAGVAGQIGMTRAFAKGPASRISVIALESIDQSYLATRHGLGDRSNSMVNSRQGASTESRFIELQVISFTMITHVTTEFFRPRNFG